MDHTVLNSNFTFVASKKRMMDILEKYAELLVHYCMEIKSGDTLLISTTTAAEPLVREVFRSATRAGAHIHLDLAIREQNRIFLEEAADHQLQYVSPQKLEMMHTFDAYLNIIAPYNTREMKHVDAAKSAARNAAHKPLNDIYFTRIGDKSLKRTLCQFPTSAAAQEADMSLEEYERFVFGACHLFEDDPTVAWLQVRDEQQHIVDYLNAAKSIRYINPRTDITFSVQGRTWINSDGRNNMPSGEVFTSPMEDSVQGFIHFDLPTVYGGHQVRGVTLQVKDGLIVSWDAEEGKSYLDEIFKISGTRYFGEAAIGTNANIQTTTRNILFDEKIGGTVHMAIGQSYKQAGGKNTSTVHWDMIADMRASGEILADGRMIYTNGKFII
ncbi:MAG: aminopeptidase [Saprospiraceae bacterium]